MSTTTPRPMAAPIAPAEPAGLPLVELRHLLDPQDAAFSRMACANPEACSCIDDYPGWTPGRTA